MSIRNLLVHGIILMRRQHHTSYSSVHRTSCLIVVQVSEACVATWKTITHTVPLFMCLQIVAKFAFACQLFFTHTYFTDHAQHFVHTFNTDIQCEVIFRLYSGRIIMCCVFYETHLFAETCTIDYLYSLLENVAMLLGNNYLSFCYYMFQ